MCAVAAKLKATEGLQRRANNWRARRSAAVVSSYITESDYLSLLDYLLLTVHVFQRVTHPRIH